MFVLKPDGDNGSEAESSFKASAKFFGKLGFYFVAIRAVHVYFGAPSEESSKSL
jgi:hypothetical protein